MYEYGSSTETPEVPAAEGGWNFADLWETHAARFPDALVAIQGARRFTWADLDRRADGVAALLLAGGVKHQDKVAQYLYSCPEYVESLFACAKAGLVPVNTNYRYTGDELVYLWDNSDAVAVVFHGCFAEGLSGLRARVPRVKTWIWVDDGSGRCPDWAVPYEAAATAITGRQIAPWGRSGDDLFLLYTGGTTGMPKGVMWRQDDIIMNLDRPSRVPLSAHASREAVEARVTKPGPRIVPGAPLMHGTGLFHTMHVLMLAGSVVTLEGRHFDVVELLDTVEREKVTTVSIVGDAFAKPILRALDAEPDRWDLSSLRMLQSSGVIWSAETKQGLLRHLPKLLMLDGLGSSEAIGLASTSTTAGEETATARFRASERTRVIADDGTEIEPGSDQVGRAALLGRTPLGYYKDPEKSLATFPVIDGKRYSIPGDFARIAADGTITLLGRGSQCINTGGEKVYPEEVEEALKRAGAVDAAVVGVPDERFGEAVTVLVELAPGHAVDERALIAHVKEHLAGYKAPKRIFVISTIGRAPNGKLDYRRLKEEAVSRVRGET